MVNSGGESTAIIVSSRIWSTVQSGAETGERPMIDEEGSPLKPYPQCSHGPEPLEEERREEAVEAGAWEERGGDGPEIRTGQQG